MNKHLDITQDRDLLQGSSGLHNMDPRLKVLTSFVLAATVALTNSWISLLGLMGTSMLLAIWGKLPLSKVVSRLAALDSILVILWLTLPLTYGGEKYYLGHIPLYVEGIKTALAITLRSNAALLGFMALLGTTPMHKNLEALRSFYFPQKLILLLHFTYRYGHVLVKEALKVQQAMELRGFDPKLNLFTLRSYGNFMGVIFLKAFKRAERVTNAMALRGFHGSFPELEPPKKVSLAEITKCAVFCAIFVGCAVI